MGNLVLPKPPSDQEKYLYIHQNRFPFYTAAICSSTLLFTGMGIFTYINIEVAMYSLFILLSLGYLMISYMVGVFGKSFDFAKHKAIVETYQGTPSVDIYLPVCKEPIEILRNTWTYVSKLKWGGKLSVYVLDDGHLDEVRDLAAEFGFNYIRRDDRPHLKKAGNIRNAFKQTSGDHILILDADFCPRPDMLREMVPYMLSDEKIGIVQSPQYFRVTDDQTWIEKGAGYIQELFYRLIQVSRNTWDASICVGSCALYRRSLLQIYGGTYPIEHSEDLHTGFSALMAGYRVRYIPIALAAGVCPNELPGYFIQQYRWCTGSTSLLFNKMFWQHKMKFMARLSYLSGMGYYVATAVGIFMTPLPSLYMVWLRPENIVWYALFFSLPSFMFGTAFIAYWGKHKFGFYSQKARLVAYYAHFFALYDKMRKSTAAWVPTGAAGSSVARFEAFRKTLYWWTTASTFLILAGIARNMNGLDDANFYPTFGFTLYNYWLSSSIFRDQ